MKIRLVSNNLGSNSLRELAKGLSNKLGYKVWRSKQPRANRVNLFYGPGVDKISQFKYFEQHGISSVEYTTDIAVAREWAVNTPVICRTLINSSEGKGIVIANTPEEIVNAPVYTKYKKKRNEYRVHIVNGKVVHVMEKRKRKGADQGEHKIRNLANGYVFCSENVVEPEGIRDLALSAAKVSSSSFQGVDIGYNAHYNCLFVIEVNSAPGIQGTNIQRYIESIV